MKFLSITFDDGTATRRRLVSTDLITDIKERPNGGCFIVTSIIKTMDTYTFDKKIGDVKQTVPVDRTVNHHLQIECLESFDELMDSDRIVEIG